MPLAMSALPTGSIFRIVKPTITASIATIREMKKTPSLLFHGSGLFRQFRSSNLRIAVIVPLRKGIESFDALPENEREYYYNADAEHEVFYLHVKTRRP